MKRIFAVRLVVLLAGLFCAQTALAVGIKEG
jgi:hypothetical protein